MELKRRSIVRGALWAAGLIALAGFGLVATAAFAHGHRHEHGELGLLMATATPDQKRQIKSVFAGERGTMHGLHDQMKAARAALTAKLLSADPSVEVSQELAQLKQAQEAMLDERIKVALKVRAIFSPEQRAQAASALAELRNLKQQERAIFQELHGSSQSSGGES